MKHEGMTGAMSAWLDTSKPAPVRMKPAIEYFPPTNEKTVKSLVEKVFEEEKRKRPIKPNLKALAKFDKGE